MASDLNRVMLIGRLTKDPELRYTQNGTAIASFSVANNKTYSTNGEKKEEVSFFNVVAWGKHGEMIVQYCKKGQRVAIEGRLQQRSWENQEGKKQYSIEIVADNTQFLSTKGEGGGAPASNSAPSQQSSGYQNAPVMDNNPFSDDDIPF